MVNDLYSVIIAGTGSYVPQKIVTNFDLEKIVDTSDQWIYERSGIKERRIAEKDEAASDMALKAAKNALIDANITAEEIDLVIVTTVTPDMAFPSTACLLQAKLGIRNNIACFDVSAACSGFVYGVEVASKMMLSGLYKNALVVASEKLSSILDWQDRNTCVLFGDGAGAVVLRTEEKSRYGIMGSVLGADGSRTVKLELPAGGSLIPATEQSVKDRLHFIKMDGREVFKNAVRIMQEKAFEVCNLCNIKPEDINLLIPHQANMRIIESVAKRLHIERERIFVNIEKYANTSSASIPIALDEAKKSGRLNTDDLLLFVAFGAGLTWGATLIRWK